jgi:phage terminase large subunit
VSSTLILPTARAFTPLLAPARYKGAYGGRGSGKSHFFGELLIEECLADRSTRAVCVREVQRSLDQSVKQLLVGKIAMLGVADAFQVLDGEIHVLDETGARRGLILFQGMQNHTADSIKSLEGYRIAWVEEAQSLSRKSLELLTPTLRAPGAQIWFSWNPRQASDPVDAFMRDPDAAGDAAIACVAVNYHDNPWFGATSLRADMERDRRRDPDKYAHVWLGAYQKRSAAAVFANWRIVEFETPVGLRPHFGADWGFSVDPTVLVKAYVDEDARRILVDAEAWAVGCEIDDTPALFSRLSGARDWPIRADSARPETIAYMNRRGFCVIPARKGPGSVEEGVAFLQNYDIWVRPGCSHTIDELSLYSYRVDRQTEAVLPVLEDRQNHVIDALRYALEDVRRGAVTAAPLRI